jgi:hypothetical protein
MSTYTTSGYWTITSATTPYEVDSRNTSYEDEVTDTPADDDAAAAHLDSYLGAFDSEGLVVEKMHPWGTRQGTVSRYTFEVTGTIDGEQTCLVAYWTDIEDED